MELTKEEFIKTLKEMQDLNRKQDDFCKCLENITEDAIIPAFIFSRSIDIIHNLLVKIMDDKEDDIGYFLYDMGAINSENLKIEKDRAPAYLSGDILYDDADSLYDYLTRRKK